MTDGFPFADAAARAAIVLGVALAVLALLHARSAALRHWILTVAMLLAAIAPAATAVLPSWNPGFGAGAGHSAVDPAVTSGISFALAGAPARDPVRDAGAPGVGAWLVRLWALGIVVFLGVLVVGLVRLAWLARRSAPLTGGDWTSLADEIARRYHLRRPVRILESDRPTLVVTWGVFRPTIVLPVAAREWSRERARVVLAHELAHAVRRDWPVQLVAECLRAVYWFNPIMWIACRRLRHESEVACDDAVLRAGVSGCDYATHLVDLARALTYRPSALPALGMARPSGLQRRVRAMLNNHLDHSSVTARARLAALAIAIALAAPVLSAQAMGAAQPDQISGRVLDQMNRPIAGASVVLTGASNDVARETLTDADGRFMLSGLQAAAYRVVVTRPGFKTHVLELALDGVTGATAEVTLDVGALSEAVTIQGRTDTTVDAQTETMISLRRRLEALDRRLQAVQCTDQPGGGHIVEPKKVVDVRPRYPTHLIAERVDGIVILEGIVTTAGTVRDLTVLREVHPDLDEAALEAVRQWEFTPTLLNCEPVEVVMTVTVNFSVGE
jgi:TonB family protein